MGTTYDATESAINDIRNTGKVESYYLKRYNAEFLYNDETKTAMLLKYIIKPTKDGFVQRKKRVYKCPYDRWKRITTVSVARRLIIHFMNHPQFMHYELAISVGSYYHEACLFFRKYRGRLEVIYFNPNYSKRTRGVQFSRTATDVLTSLGRVVTKVQAFWSQCGNKDGECSKLTWRRVHDFLFGDSPFDDKNLKLTDYNHYATAYSYSKYFFNGGKIEFQHFDLWKDIEEIMQRNKASRSDMMEILKSIQSLILDNLYQ